ncbi:hypothetical protein [Kingella potus]|uniref:hypothetical protein n=1 Tax=Kingella potus TaxID=265175 RepID=UPI001FD0770C|nr:hypothetical protein [Kingella potus]UOP01365.1 hypothetical protein LVJ84_03770 [Kingella potus]
MQTQPKGKIPTLTLPRRREREISPVRAQRPSEKRYLPFARGYGSTAHPFAKIRITASNRVRRFAIYPAQIPRRVCRSKRRMHFPAC